MLRRVFQLDKVTREEIESYESVLEAEAKTGVNRIGIWDVLKGGRHTSGGFIWEWRGVDKRLFRHCETLAIDEYVYLYGMSLKELAMELNVAPSTLNYANDKGTCRKGTKTLLGRLGIDPSRRVPRSHYHYIPDDLQPVSYVEFVEDTLSTSPEGEFKCVDEVEAKEICRVLKKNRCVHYCLRRGHVIVVKYDVSIENE